MNKKRPKYEVVIVVVKWDWSYVVRTLKPRTKEEVYGTIGLNNQGDLIFRMAEAGWLPVQIVISEPPFYNDVRPPEYKRYYFQRKVIT